MKKSGLLMLFLLLVPVWLMANPIDKESAKQKALSFISGRRPALARGTQLEQSLTVALTNADYHVFNVGSGDGFVVVSGDDCTDDILGYADSGTFNAQDMPENLRSWLQGYSDQIAWMKANGVVSRASDGSSEGAVNARQQKAPRSKISPLLTSQWNQGDPYNRQTPGNRVTGCVATAIAQVMYYWYKKEGFKAELEKDIPKCSDVSPTLESLRAPETFDWAHMTDEYGNSSTTTEQDAVAELMKYVGYSVKMDYGYSNEGGSSANPGNIAPALTDKFGYKSAHYIRACDYSYADWQTVVYTDLAAGRPVLYGGRSTGGGHRFVCDGYDESDYFHFNWGWAGKSDGYYKLNLCDAKSQGIGGSTTNGAYYIGQTAVCGLHPTQTTSLPISPMNTASNDNVSLTGISIPTLNVNEDATITLTLSNSNKTTAYHGIITIYLYVIDRWRTIGGAIADIAAKGSQTLTVPVAIPQVSTGTYYLSIECGRPYEGGRELRQQTVTVSAALPNLTGTVSFKGNQTEAGSAQSYQLSGTVSTLSAASRHPQWQMSKDGERWEDIAGATQTTFTPQTSDVGKYVRVVVRADGYHSALVSDDREVTAPTLEGTVSYTDVFPSPGSKLTYKLSGKVANISANLISAQWQSSANGETGWMGISGATGTSYTLTKSDLNRYIRVRIKATNYVGTLYSTPRQCVKAACTQTPETPKLENSSYHNQIVVTNPKDAQEYIILNYKKEISNLTESDWAKAKTRNPDYPTLPMGGSVNTVNYVYTRVKETETTLAGTDVRMTAIYFGENIYLQSISLTPYRSISPVSIAGMTQENNYYYVKVGDVIRIDAASIPANATNYSGIYYDQWINNSKSGTFYADHECTRKLEEKRSYKTVYFKVTKAGNYVDISAQFTKGYNDIARDAFTLNVADASGRWLASSMSATIDVGKGESVEGQTFSAYPGKATLHGAIIKQLNGTGKAPKVSFNATGSAISVDATNATKGSYFFEVYQNAVKVVGGIRVNVVTPAVEEVRLLPGKLTLDCGQSQQLTAQLLPVGAEEDITWTSSNPSVATVTADGVVTVTSNADIGATATITAKAGDLSATCEVTVPGEKYFLYLCGEQVTSRNMNNLAEMVAETSDEAMEKYMSGDMDITFDGQTLVFKNVVIDTGDKTAQGMTLGIDGMTLWVEGTCSVSSKNYSGLKVGSNVTIAGDGVLFLSGGDNGILFDSNGANRFVTLTLDNAKIWATGGNCGVLGSISSDYKNSMVLNHSVLWAVCDKGAVTGFTGDIMLNNSYLYQPEDARIFNGSVMSGKELATNVIFMPLDKGDVNSDGKVDIVDVTLAISYILGQNPSNFLLKAADVTGDDKIDIVDVTSIISIVLGGQSHSLPNIEEKMTDTGFGE